MTPGELKQALSRDWVHGQHVDARGIKLDEPLDLDGQTLCSFDLSGAEFAAGLSARKAVFRGMSWLHGAKINGTCDLSGAIFRNDLRLDGLICDTLILNSAQFEGVLSLDNAQIGTLNLAGCICLANLSLSGTVVSGKTDLSDAILMGGVWARGAGFGTLETLGMDVEGRRMDL